MKITQIDTIYGRQGSDKLVTHYVKTNYDSGNSTIDVIRRQYSVLLYDKDGKEKKYTNNGKVVDLQT